MPATLVQKLVDGCIYYMQIHNDFESIVWKENLIKTHL